MNKPYHERPDWILKAIGYYCDNYTIDGEDLSKKKAEALSTYRNPKIRWIGLDDSIMQRLEWDMSPQGFDFWDCLWCLMIKGEEPNHQEMKCSAWTDDEKRKIAKLPEVK